MFLRFVQHKYINKKVMNDKDQSFWWKQLEEVKYWELKISKILNVKEEGGEKLYSSNSIQTTFSTFYMIENHFMFDRILNFYI